MNFPHRDVQGGRRGTSSMLAHAAARQAASPTVRAMQFAQPCEAADGDSVARRIHYFAGHIRKGNPFGAFSDRSGNEPTNKRRCESVVYQTASTNFKTTEAKDAFPVAASLSLAAGGSRTI